MGSLLIPSLILLVAVIFDVKTYKIPNEWVVISIILALLSSYYFYDFEGLKQGAMGAGIAIMMMLPLVLLGVLGAGDMKLMFAFGLASTYPAVFTVIVFSFLWAAIVGLLFAVLKGRAVELLMHMFRIVTTGQSDKEGLQKIPYTIALMLGWITFLILGFKQGAFI
jgi:prepilin peptidase CpaA